MKAAPSQSELERLRALITRRLGLWFDDAKFAFLAEVLQRRSVVVGEDLPGYLSKLEAGSRADGELRELAAELTVGGDLLFSPQRSVSALLPRSRCPRASRPARRPNKSGCSRPLLFGRRAVHAFDPDPGQNPGRELDDFHHGDGRQSQRARPGPTGSLFALGAARDAGGRSEALVRGRRSRVRARQFGSARRSLRGREPDRRRALGSGELRRGVLSQRAHVLQSRRCGARRAEALPRARPGGLLVPRPRREPARLSQDFDLLHTHDTFYYQRKSELARPTQTARPWSSSSPQAPPLPEPLDWTNTWLETVARSSARIRELTAQPTSTPARVPTLPPALDLSLALELLAHERFAEALEVLYALPSSSAQNADAVLLRAALLTHSGRIEAAEVACAELLALDGLSAGAHYLRGPLSRARRGSSPCFGACPDRKLPGSRICDAASSPWLDGAPHRRPRCRGARAGPSGAALAARRRLAFVALRRGFNREGLIALCRSELARMKELA